MQHQRCGDNGVSSGGCRDAVSGAVREEVCACLFVVRSYLSILQSPCAWQRFRTRYCPRMRPTLGTFLPIPVGILCDSLIIYPHRDIGEISINRVQGLYPPGIEALARCPRCRKQIDLTFLLNTVCYSEPMATLLTCRFRVADTYAHHRSGTQHIMLHLQEHSVSRIYAHAVSNARPVIHAHNVQTHNVVFPEPGIMPCPMLRTRRDTLFSKGSAHQSSFACRQSGSCMRFAT